MSKERGSTTFPLTCFAVMVSAALAAVGPSTAEAQIITRMEFLGGAVLDKQMAGDPSPVGGLSGITYSPAEDLYYVISDDRSEKGPARFYRLRIDLSDGSLDTGDLQIAGVTTLLDVDDEVFPGLTVDPEGIALSANGDLFISSEGYADNQEPPFVRLMATDGVYRDQFPLPRRYRPRKDGDSGIRQNLGFEALALSPDGLTLWTATENALIQDGPQARVNVPSPARLLKYDADRRRLEAEYLYWVDAVAQAPTTAQGLAVNGLTELLALGGDNLLALERSFSTGAGHNIRLYAVTVGAADNIEGEGELDLAAVVPVRKSLLFDFATLGRPLDNVEGMTFGPTLPDGRRTLIFVADDNFSREQENLFLAFAVSQRPITVMDVQGAGHRSPLDGLWVTWLEGLVTAADEGEEQPGFWLQHPRGDGDDATSDALFVATPNTSLVREGDAVRVAGRITEREAPAPGQLSVTTIQAGAVEVLSRGNALPRPVILGQGGRAVPTGHVDDDALASFQPEADALDFFESLEGMWIEVRDAVVVGPTTYFGGLAILPDGGAASSPRSPAGGVVLTEDDLNPEIVTLDTRLLDNPPITHVGDRFRGPVTGILDYAYGRYSLVAAPRLPPVAAPGRTADSTSLKGDAEHLTVATYNVLNLDAQDSPETFQRLARSIVLDLGAPDVIAVQEIQDDSGPEDDGTVTAQATLLKLTGAIEAAGGPLYFFRQIDPLNNGDGGQPGGNIRVAYLFNPQRVIFVDRGEARPTTAVTVQTDGDGPRLSHSPGRIAPLDPAFAGDEARGFEGTRKSLAAEVFFQGNRLFLINNHLKSKRGDDPVFGATQPPQRATEQQRSAQTEILRSFIDQILGAQALANVIVLGDLNEHEFRKPLKNLTEQRPGRFSLTNLMEWIPQTDRYTYNYLGNSQVLDHVLISPNLVVNGSPEIDIVHVNADYADARSASDHDAVVVRLHLPPGN